MKLSKSTYFSIFFLLCFLASFSTNIYRSVNTVSKSALKHYSTLSYSAKDTDSSSDNEFLFEENEDTVEDGFHPQSYFLPFFLCTFYNELSKPVIAIEQSIAEKLAKPIYISVRNFRI